MGPNPQNYPPGLPSTLPPTLQHPYPEPSYQIQPSPPQQPDSSTPYQNQSPPVTPPSTTQGAVQPQPLGGPAPYQAGATTISMPTQERPVQYANPPTQDAPPRRSRIHAKVRTALIAGLLSLLAIGLAYGMRLEPIDLLRNPEGPLVASVLLTIITLVFSVWIYAEGSFGALLPVISSLVAGGLLILLFAALQDFKNNFNLVDINVDAVIVSYGVFGGIGLGSTIAYIIFA